MSMWTPLMEVKYLIHPTRGATAKRCIRNACAANEHDWVELTGFEETAYWRECRECGIADVTAQALGQDVETPTAKR
jgi:hypothetical protein